MIPKPTQEILQTSRVLARVYAAYPEWKTAWKDLAYPEQGCYATTLFIGNDYVVKSANNDRKSEKQLSIESWILRHFTREANRQKMTMRELLGVDVPPYIAPRESFLSKLFVMGRVEGQQRAHFSDLSDHPDVIDQTATFFIQMDRILSTAFANYQPDPHDKLDQIMATYHKQYEEEKGAEPALTSWMEPSDYELGKAYISDFTPTFTPYLERAERTLARMLKQPPSTSRMMHGDFHARNSLLYPYPEEGTGEARINVSVIDFGILFHGDPHIGFANMFAGTGSSSYNMLLKVINEVNKRSIEETQKPWVDPVDCLALLPLVLAERTAKKLRPAGGTLTQIDLHFINMDLSARTEDAAYLIDNAKSCKGSPKEIELPSREASKRPASSALAYSY